ncbi:hypothetical protein [Nonomuraea endophytica]|uniref:Uncharacterized protein n=1 Tax=Nonomuraea endophytica TaxID=714136 RepID=A0A7W8EJ07_9ACTN|nr:hypothetical protein [Nonomuraea endophytica]MBB5080217.1 hypothetical protein [Nonomuraea endophytica]
MRAIVGFILLIQGVAGFVGLTFFDSKWGLLHRVAEVPNWGYLAIGLVGAGLVMWGESAKKKS